MQLPPLQTFGSQEIDRLIGERQSITEQTNDARASIADAEQKLASAVQEDRHRYAEAVTNDAKEPPNKAATQAAQDHLQACRDKMQACRDATMLNNSAFGRAFAEQAIAIEQTLGEKQEAARVDLLTTLESLSRSLHRWTALEAAKQFAADPFKGEELRPFIPAPLKLNASGLQRSESNAISADRLIALIAAPLETARPQIDAEVMAIAGNAGLVCTSIERIDSGPARCGTRHRRVDLQDIAADGLSLIRFTLADGRYCPVLIASKTLDKRGMADVVTEVAPRVARVFAGRAPLATTDDPETQRILGRFFQNQSTSYDADELGQSARERTEAIRGESAHQREKREKALAGPTAL